MKDTKSKGNSARTRAHESVPIRLDAARIAAIRALLAQAEAGLAGEPLDRAAKLIIIATLHAVLDATERGEIAVQRAYHLIYAGKTAIPYVTGKQGNEIEQKGW